MPRIKPQDCAGNTNSRLNTDWCSGCGLYFYVNGNHRSDCTHDTKEKADATP
ncbi:hypothetical protein SEA_RYADEL_4 [Mycobacterium phage Ryadel]|uniref:Uncharacterized protein n=1 Tax=Mycobacterium phage Ryadel TaxID=2283292 RepID=A0A345MEX8_9CAUD|nr:hypothetical protein KNU03_gp004 [Mycobacterium phage Ryadel]AXH69109.1 hypothetical protein SEA_RYADEL_4 [Mycobacterium phage Ryadel]